MLHYTRILENHMSTSDPHSSFNADQLRAQLETILNTSFVAKRRFCAAEMLLTVTLMVGVVSTFLKKFEGFNAFSSVYDAFLGGGMIGLLGLLGVWGVYGFSRDKTLAQQSTLEIFIGLSKKCATIDVTLAPTLARIAHQMEHTHLDQWWVNVNGVLQQYVDHNSVAIAAHDNFENQKQDLIDCLNHTHIEPSKPKKTTLFRL